MCDELECLSLVVFVQFVFVLVCVYLSFDYDCVCDYEHGCDLFLTYSDLSVPTQHSLGRQITLYSPSTCHLIENDVNQMSR